MPAMPAASSWRRFAAVLLDLALPAVCASCDAPSGPLCEPCERDLRWELFDRPRLAMPSPAPPLLPPVVAAGPYAGVLRTVVSAYKDDERRDLRPVLAGVLSGALLEVVRLTALGHTGRPLVVVPVPSSRAAVRRRGDDPVGDLARSAARLAGRAGATEWPLLPALRPVRRLADQSRLGREDRARNLAGAYAVHPRWEPRVIGPGVVLVDDVVTTGSTLEEAARAVSAVGGQVVGPATLAATTRRRLPSPVRGEGSRPPAGPFREAAMAPRPGRGYGRPRSPE